MGVAQTPPPAIEALGFTRRPSSAAARALTPASMRLLPACPPSARSFCRAARLRIYALVEQKKLGVIGFWGGFLISLSLLFAMKMETLFSHVNQCMYKDESVLLVLRLFSFIHLYIQGIGNYTTFPRGMIFDHFDFLPPEKSFFSGYLFFPPTNSAPLVEWHLCICHR